MDEHRRLYLFTLEIVPMNVGETYPSLPSHLTLISRFWSSLPPGKLAKIAGPLFERTRPIELLFGETTQLGPQRLTVHLIKNTKHIKALHSRLCHLLDATGVTYVYPQYVGKGHKPHVTRREGVPFDAGHKQTASAAYLIEVEVNGANHMRFIRAKFAIVGGPASESLA